LRDHGDQVRALELSVLHILQARIARRARYIVRIRVNLVARRPRRHVARCEHTQGHVPARRRAGELTRTLKHVVNERHARRAILHADHHHIDGDLVLGRSPQIAQEEEPQEQRVVELRVGEDERARARLGEKRFVTQLGEGPWRARCV
jgi:hypothetical protein